MNAGTWITIAQGVLTFVLGWLSWSMRAVRRDIRSELRLVTNEMKARVDQVEKKQSEFDLDRKLEKARVDQMHAENQRAMAALREDTPRREDLIRETSRTRLTLEQLMVGLARMEGGINMGTQIASAIRTMAETVKNESRH